MATTFLEPGGDADFSVASTNGFWKNGGSGTIATDFVHGGHIKSIKYAPNTGQVNITPDAALVNTGSRISLYVYFNALPSATSIFLAGHTTLGLDVDVFSIRITSAGVLQIWRGDGGTPSQIGTNGSTLSTGQWYRISLAFTISSTTVNRFELFVNGVSSISITNATLFNTTPSSLRIGNLSSNVNLDFRSSDHYIDNSNSLTDTGDVWVTAKRPNANGFFNNFTTQIGSGGSGYGSGHSPQVNERPLDTANGWSRVVTGTAITEEYNIESKSTGDIDISTATIIDIAGWVSTKALVGETAIIRIDGNLYFQAITTTITLYVKYTGISTYPSGSGEDIGLTTATTSTTVSLYECGILVAYIPGSAPSGPANLKTYNTNVKSNIKTINTNPIANVKSLDTNV